MKSEKSDKAITPKTVNLKTKKYDNRNIKKIAQLEKKIHHITQQIRNLEKELLELSAQPNALTSPQYLSTNDAYQQAKSELAQLEAQWLEWNG